MTSTSFQGDAEMPVHWHPSICFLSHTHTHTHTHLVHAPTHTPTHVQIHINIYDTEYCIKRRACAQMLLITECPALMGEESRPLRNSGLFEMSVVSFTHFLHSQSSLFILSWSPSWSFEGSPSGICNGELKRTVPGKAVVSLFQLFGCFEYMLAD